MTETRPTSEPVPAVVGTATTGAIPSVSARVQLSPMSSRSQIDIFWPAISAMALPASRALPPPNAITPSWPPSLKALTPCSTLVPVGFGCTSLNTEQLSPSDAHAASACSRIGKSARPGSVTNRGFLILRPAQHAPSSERRCSPTRIDVG